MFCGNYTIVNDDGSYSFDSERFYRDRFVLAKMYFMNEEFEEIVKEWVFPPLTLYYSLNAYKLCQGNFDIFKKEYYNIVKEYKEKRNFINLIM